MSTLIVDTLRTTNAADYDATAIETVCAAFTPTKILAQIDRERVLVCHRGSHLVATIGLRDNQLRAVFVAPRYQGQGIGRQIVEHVEGMIRASGTATVRVHSSLTARAFYERLGYRFESVSEHDDGTTTIVMEKEF